MPATGVIIIDAANVVGSTPDGWWRDRRGATRRLRDRLGNLAHHGLARWPQPPPLTVILVAEGKARGLPSTDNVTVIDAPGPGDDTIVDLVTDHQPRPVLVVTSDRGLTRRVAAAKGQTLPVSALNPPPRNAPRHLPPGTTHTHDTV